MGSKTWAMNQQKERIRQADILEEKLNTIDEEKKCTMKAAWSDNLDLRSQGNAEKAVNMRKRGELIMTGVALEEIRRYALKQLYDSEREEWQRILHAHGKTFYTERI